MQQLTWRERERQAREGEIISAAVKVFLEKGYETASMDEIAKQAHFTKRTIYQYFMNKEDLYFAVAVKSLRQLLGYFDEALSEGRTGFERYRLCCLAYYSYFRDFPNAMRLMNYGQFIQGQKEICPHFQELMQMNEAMFTKFIAMLEEGKRDGSIRADLDARKGAYAAVYMTIGFFQLLSGKGMNITKYHGLDMEEFIQYTIDLICDAVRA